MVPTHRKLVVSKSAQTKKDPKPGGRAISAMRWDLPKAAIEFGTDTRVLLKKLEVAHQAPDARGRYSTRQIIDACFDNQYQHRSALLAAQTEKLAIQNAVKRGELVPVKEVKAFWGKAATTLRPLILAMTAPGNCKSAMIS
jgi:hypothetical protein